MESILKVFTDNIFVHSILLSFILSYIFILVANNVGLVDKPDRKIKDHKYPVPLVGGLIVTSIVLFLTINNLVLPNYFYVIGVGCTCAVIIGTIDDFSPFHPLYRLLLQLLLGIYTVSVSADLRLLNLGVPIWGFDWQLGLLSIPISALGVSGLANGYNMSDGIDGLTASATIVSLSGILFLASHSAINLGDITILLKVIIICLVVFLCFNFRLFRLPKIFLGDAGSLTIGVFMALLLIDLSQGANKILYPATALWIAGVPLVDMASTMIRRYKKGKAMWKGDKAHLHHLLLGIGLKKATTLIILIFISIVLATIGIALNIYLPEDYQLLSVLLFFSYGYLHYTLSVKKAWLVSKTVRKLLRK